MARMRNGYATQGSADALSQALTGWLEETSPTSLWQTCATCYHMQQKGPAHCKKYNMVPPVDVIVGNTTCAAYDDSEDIPF